MNNRPLNILIADDDKDDIDFLTEAICDNFPLTNIVSVRDGIAAIRHLKTAMPPDIVFLDLNMPLKNGLHCLKDIYNLDLLPNKPVVIYSTSNVLKDIDEAYKYNASFYIVKPASFKEASKMIKYVVTYLINPENKRVGKNQFFLNETKLNSPPADISPV